MEEFEHKISELLSSPEGMDQIISLARSFIGGNNNADTAGSSSEQQEKSSFDLAMISKIAGALGKFSESGNDRKTVLIEALKPYLNESRRSKVDRAVSLMRMTKLVRAALSESEGGNDVV